MNININGELVEIFDKMNVTDKFSKREFVVRSMEQLPNGEFIEQHYKCQVTNKNCDILNGFKVGQFVDVSCNLGGKRYEKNNNVMYFTTLECWKINLHSNEGMEAVANAGQNSKGIEEAGTDSPF